MEKIPDSDEAGLVEAWRAGDQRARAAIVERYFDSVYRFFRSKCRDGVDDLVQQTFVSCLEARESFRGECSFRTLLFGIARRRLYDHYRNLRRVRALDFTTTSVRAMKTSASAALIRRDEISMLEDALQELPVESQMLLELHYWEGLSTRELAQVFEVPEGTIKSRQSNARARLRSLLSVRGYGEEAPNRPSSALASERAGPTESQGACIAEKRAGLAIDCDANQPSSTSGDGSCAS